MGAACVCVGLCICVDIRRRLRARVRTRALEGGSFVGVSWERDAECSGALCHWRCV